MIEIYKSPKQTKKKKLVTYIQIINIQRLEAEFE